jgi:hypothetical protein
MDQLLSDYPIAKQAFRVVVTWTYRDRSNSVTKRPKIILPSKPALYGNFSVCRAVRAVLRWDSFMDRYGEAVPQNPQKRS